MSDIVARLIVQLIDNISGPAAKGEAALNKLGSAGKNIGRGSSAEIDKLAASLKNAEAEARKLGDFRNSLAGFQKARAEYRGAQADIEGIAKRLKEARQLEASWKAEFQRNRKAWSEDYALAKRNLNGLERDYKNAQRAVKSASSEFRDQADSVGAARKSLSDMGISLNEVASAEKRVQESIKATSEALKQQQNAAPSRPSALRRLMSRSAHLASGIGMVAGPGILTGTYKGIRAGANIEHEIALARQAGVPEDQIQDFVNQSIGLQSKYMNVSRASTIATGKELRSVLSTPGDASELLATTMRAKSALDMADPSGESSKDLKFAVKAAEILGKAKSAEEFTKFMDAFVRSKQVMGDLITSEGLMDYAKFAKSSGAFLSDRFNSTTGASLSMEVGGSTAGKNINQFIKQVTGGFQGNLHSAAKEFVALGLANSDDFITTKTGEIKGMKPGHNVKDAGLAATDPDLWVYNTLLPAIRAKGITDPQQTNMLINRLFPNTNASDFVSKLITQQPSFANHAGLYPSASGMKAADQRGTDPYQALNNLSGAMSNFGATLSQPIMANAASIMNGMASGLSSLATGLAQWGQNNPLSAKVLGAGAISAGVAGGAYLTYSLGSFITAGPALNAAAASLEAAAVSLGGAGVAGKAGGAIGGGSSKLGKFISSIAVLGTVIEGLNLLHQYNDKNNNFLGLTGKTQGHRSGDNFRAGQGGASDGGNDASQFRGPRGPLNFRAGQGASGPGDTNRDRLDSMQTKAAQVKASLAELNTTVINPNVSLASLQALMSLIDKVKSGLSSLNSMAHSAANNVHADVGVGGM